MIARDKFRGPTGRLGARIRGVDLAAAIDDGILATIEDALHDPAVAAFLRRCDEARFAPSSDNPLSLDYAFAGSGTGSARHGFPSRSMAQHRTNSFRARATIAGFFRLTPPPVSRAYCALAHGLYRNMHHAHSTNSFRKIPGPRRVIRPFRSVTPLWYCFGTKPAYAPTCLAVANRFASPRCAATASAVRGPTPGMDSSNRVASSFDAREAVLSHRQLQQPLPHFVGLAIGQCLRSFLDAGQSGDGPGSRSAGNRQTLTGEQRSDAVLAPDPLADQFLTRGDEHASLPCRGIGQGHSGELANRFEFGESLGVVVIGLTLEVLKLPRFRGGVGNLDGVPGGDSVVVNPTSVGTRLDDDKRTWVSSQKLREFSGRGVERAEVVFARRSLVNARDALVPPEVDGQNGVRCSCHRKPPNVKGDHPSH